MIDVVLTHPHPPLTCGVARFSHQLAARLGVPCDVLDKRPYAYPLISVKSSEADGEWPTVALWYRQFDLFLHDNPHGLCSDTAVRKARHVYAGNRAIVEQVAWLRGEVGPAIEAFCPGTLSGDVSRGPYRVLVFGMGHKLNLPKFRELRAQLEREQPAGYTVSLSTAVHEGTDWPTVLADSEREMRAIFGDRLRVLGFLGDDALAKELQECDAVAAYFEPALRANNTSAWAALEAGKKLYTNLDEFSPPLDPALHSWEKLVELIRGA